MANQVYANGREISCKAADGKSIAAFPDVCFTPPQTPATPPGVPIPYPNTAMASDTADGSKSVKISGKEIMLKNKSYFKKSSGDEAGSAPKKGVVTSTNTGKAYFASYSMDVKFEAENVVRHLDITTHNHSGQNPSQTPPMPYTDEMTGAFGPGGVCDGMDHLELTPFKKKCPPNANGSPQTPHHLIPGRCMGNIASYNHREAPCICVSQGNQYQGSHELCHGRFDPVELKHFEENKTFHYETARNTAAESAGQALQPPRELDEQEKKCVAHQLDNYYTASPPNGPGCSSSTPLRASPKPGKVTRTAHELELEDM